MKLFGSRRTKPKEVIKKPNGMSHLIDTERVSGNRKGKGREEEWPEKRRKKGLFKLMCEFLCTCVTVYRCMCDCIMCLCPHKTLECV